MPAPRARGADVRSAPRSSPSEASAGRGPDRSPRPVANEMSPRHAPNDLGSRPVQRREVGGEAPACTAPLATGAVSPTPVPTGLDLPAPTMDSTEPALTRRQRDVVEFFARYVETEGISPTLEEIAAHFGVNKVTVFGHIEELERKGVIRRRGRGVSRALELVDGSGIRRAGNKTLPILGTIAAGAPIEEIEDRETLDLTALVPTGADVFALRVQGNSMIEDAIADGDIVLVERRDSARNGETVVAVLPEGNVTLKRFYKEKDRIRLQPANATMQPIYARDVQVRGVVVGVVRRY